MATYINTSIDAASWARAEALMARLPVILHSQIMPRVLRLTARPVVEMGRRLGREHDSTVTGTRFKQSRALQAQRAGLMHLWETVASRIRTYDNWTTVALVGPSWPAGNLMNFWSHEKRHILWGQADGGILPMLDFMIRAADQTRAAQTVILIYNLQVEVMNNIHAINAASGAGVNAGFTP